jgi:hypothetical protein
MVTLPSGGFTCTVSSFGVTQSCLGVARPLPGPDGAEGVELSLSGPQSFDVVDGGPGNTNIILQTSSGGAGILTAGTLVALSWDVLVSVTSDGIVGGPIGSFFVSDTLSSTGLNRIPGVRGSTEFSGSSIVTVRGDVDLDNPGSYVYFHATFQTSGSNADSNYTVTIERAVADITPLPEPGSFGLIGAALALLGWRLAPRLGRRPA